MRLQEELDHFRRCVEEDRLGQAYCVVGAPRKEGLAFAEGALGMLLCGEPERGCGRCRACRDVSGHTHPDVLWVEPRKRSRLIAIEQIRDLQRRIYHTSFEGGWKACVVMGADRLGDAAANAFLKTLEEPPGRSLFLLLTDSPQFLLPTIRSRCQQILLSGGESELPGPWRERLVSLLRKAGNGRSGPVLAFARADRMLRLLREIRAEVEAEQRNRAAEETAQEEDATIDARIASRYREARSEAMRAMLGWYRDILLLACGGDAKLIRNVESVEALERCAQERGRRGALRDVETVRGMHRKMERNIPEETVLGWGFSQLGDG